MHRFGVSCVVAALFVALSPINQASAGGLFYAGSGTRALGRGAAYHVRADDPMALLYNPAKLADLNGTQLLVNANVALLDACVNPAGAVDDGGVNTAVTDANNPEAAARDRGTYRENVDIGGSGAKDVTRYGAIPAGTNPVLRRSWLGTTMPEVCNTTAVTPVPNLVLTHQLFKRPQAWPPTGKHGLTIAFGMVAPGAVAKTSWGGEDGSVRAKHATAEQYAELTGKGNGDLGKRLPGGVRPDVVCNPAEDPNQCRGYCDPDNFTGDPDCNAGAQLFCDPSKYDCDRLPTPTRHMLVTQDPFAIPLTLGFGYRPLPWLAVGGAFTYQAVFFKSSVYAVQGQKSVPETDMRIDNDLVDYFVPMVNVSAIVTPMQGLEFAAYYKWQDAIRGKTKVTVTDSVDSLGGEGERVPVKTVIGRDEGIVMTVPQPWEVGGGVRFALPRTGYIHATQPITRGDPMKDEWFDLEVDYVLEHNATVKEFVLTSKMNAFDTFNQYDPRDNGQNGDAVAYDGSPRPQTTSLTFLKRMALKRHWQNQHVVRVGGDVNVIPGVLAVRAGYNFETRGVTPSYQSIDAFPSRRQGLHAGFTWRIHDALDLSAAYAHLFQETITVRHRDAAPSNCDPADPSCLLPDRAGLAASSPQEGTVAVNAGTYQVHWDVFSLGITRRF